MVVFVNGFAAGGTGLAKWRKIQRSLQDRLGNMRVCAINGAESTRRSIEREVCAGETRFVAAGGDGTVNFLASTLIEVCSPDQRAQISLGAVGTGSSNDFHKPFRDEALESGIPLAVDFDHACERDIGCLTYADHDVVRRRYFLVNASVGVTANANARFNAPDQALSFLKRWCTGGAILYAALQAIAGYRDIPVEIGSRGTALENVSLSNLGIVKNPWFSGDLSYGGAADYQNGLFDIFLCHSMKGGELLQLLGSLQGGCFPAAKGKTEAWKSSSITVSSTARFAVEFDGEIVHTDRATFDVVPRLLRVCP